MNRAPRLLFFAAVAGLTATIAFVLAYFGAMWVSREVPAAPPLALPGPVAQGGVYRGDGLLVGARVACGAREALLVAAEAKMAHLDAFGLAAIALTAAPLIASAVVGIVL